MYRPIDNCNSSLSRSLQLSKSTSINSVNLISSPFNTDPSHPIQCPLFLYLIFIPLDSSKVCLHYSQRANISNSLPFVAFREISYPPIAIIIFTVQVGPAILELPQIYLFIIHIWESVQFRIYFFSIFSFCVFLKSRSVGWCSVVLETKEY